MTRTHGNITAYAAGCRCDECRAAHTDYRRKLRAGNAYQCRVCFGRYSSPLALRTHMRRMHTGEEVLLQVMRPPFDLSVIACADEPEVMFPTSSGAEVRAAKAICGRCPVALECLKWAMGNGETEGVWGGHWMGSREDRRKARKVVGM